MENINVHKGHGAFHHENIRKTSLKSWLPLPELPLSSCDWQRFEALEGHLTEVKSHTSIDTLTLEERSELPIQGGFSIYPSVSKSFHELKPQDQGYGWRLSF